MSKVLFNLVIASSVALAACSTHNANFKYSEVSNDIPVKNGALDGEELGIVEGSSGGAIWNNCEEEAKNSVKEMIRNAEAKGATAVGNVQWSATKTSQPGCKKSWGLLIVWPFVLTPLFMSSKITGTAYKGSKKMGLLMLPTTPQAESALIKQLTM